MRNGFVWTEPEDLIITLGWRAGQTRCELSEEIRAQLGLDRTPNSIGGRIHRLGLERHSPRAHGKSSGRSFATREPAAV